MNEDMMLSLDSMTRMMGIGGYRPGDDGPSNPFGPFGPVAYIWQRLNYAALNPQPLPPGPQPDPWRVVHQAQTAINEAVIQHSIADMVAGDTGGQVREMIGRNLSRLIDDWCGTPPRKWPFPWPPPWWFVEVYQPEELVMMGLQFKIAAAAETPFQGEFADAAQRLMDAGMSQMG